MFNLFKMASVGAVEPQRDQGLHQVLGSPIAAPAQSGQGEALFGCGCFWGAEKGFWRLPGVVTTAVGYAGGQLANPSYGPITTQIASGQHFYAAEVYHQQYLAKPGSRPYCSAQPSGVPLGAFAGADYRLDPRVWQAYDWSIDHCVLRGDNAPIVIV